MGRIWVELGVKIGEAEFIYILHRMAPTRVFGLVGATPQSFMAPTRRISSGRRHASLENQGGAAPTRRILLVGAACTHSFFLSPSILDSFSSLPSPFPSINLRNANPRSYVQAPCCLQIIATPWNHNELSKTLQNSLFLARSPEMQIS